MHTNPKRSHRSRRQISSSVVSLPWMARSLYLFVIFCLFSLLCSILRPLLSFVPFSLSFSFPSSQIIAMDCFHDISLSTSSTSLRMLSLSWSRLPIEEGFAENIARLRHLTNLDVRSFLTSFSSSLQLLLPSFLPFPSLCLSLSSTCLLSSRSWAHFSDAALESILENLLLLETLVPLLPPLLRFPLSSFLLLPIPPSLMIVHRFFHPFSEIVLVCLSSSHPSEPLRLS